MSRRNPKRSLSLTLAIAILASLAFSFGFAQTPLDYHNGYWVTEMEVEGVPLPTTVINDMHVDPATNRVTVYSQTRIRDQVIAPAQVGSGECTETPNGETACFHPDAVYLNGSGQELSEADGTGSWWVNHSWVLPDENGEGGEGYINCELKLAESYDDCGYAVGVLLDDGLSMKVGATDIASGGFYNIRTPLLDESPIRYSVTRFAPKNTDPEAGEVDLTPTAQWELIWDCKEEVSAFDNQVRSCPGTKN